jgi:hypothetical protein
MVINVHLSCGSNIYVRLYFELASPKVYMIHAYSSNKELYYCLCG